MIPKRHRRIAKSEIDTLYRSGARARIPGGFLCYQKNNKDHTRLAVSVSNRAASGAVERNRVRRKVQAAARPLFSEHAPKRDYLVIWTGEEATDMTRLTREFNALIH